jgi:hypothetical protein
LLPAPAFWFTRFLNVPPRPLFAAALVVRRGYLIVVLKPMPAAPRRYLIVLPRQTPAAPRRYLLICGAQADARGAAPYSLV